MTTAQRPIVLLCAVLLGVQIIRSAVVGALAENSPQTAARLWPGHPEVAVQAGMIAIASETGKHAPAPPGALAALTNAALKAPLAPEPFLVRGVQAQIERRDDVALASFLAAERRDPRSASAHYFLAERDLRRGDAVHGLAEIAALSRVAPNGSTAVAPFVAVFARDRGNWPAVRALFRDNPAIAQSALAEMASDAANAEAITALSDPRSGLSKAAWLAPLVNSLIAAGDYRKARVIWANGAGVAASRGDNLYDPGFSQPAAPPPFNWSLTSSPVGLAERQPGGRLHAIFYGQQDGPLARQLLLLGPGSYRVAMRASASPEQAASFIWAISCAKAPDSFSRIALASAVQRGWAFTVPSGCPAQWLELVGVSSDIARQSEVIIAGLELSRTGNGG